MPLVLENESSSAFLKSLKMLFPGAIYLSYALQESATDGLCVVIQGEGCPTQLRLHAGTFLLDLQQPLTTDIHEEFEKYMSVDIQNTLMYGTVIRFIPLPMWQVVVRFFFTWNSSISIDDDVIIVEGGDKTNRILRDNASFKFSPFARGRYEMKISHRECQMGPAIQPAHARVVVNFVQSLFPGQLHYVQ